MNENVHMKIVQVHLINKCEMQLKFYNEVALNIVPMSINIKTSGRNHP